jgi:hypothetical protein
MVVRRSVALLALALFAAGCNGEGNPLAVQQYSVVILSPPR